MVVGTTHHVLSVVLCPSPTGHLLRKVCTRSLPLVPMILFEEGDYFVQILDVKHCLEIHYCHAFLVIARLSRVVLPVHISFYSQIQLYKNKLYYREYIYKVN